MFGKANRFCPTLEVLERRDVPAGNVTAVVVNGSLIVTGDAEANEIEIRNEFNSYNLRINGLNGTSINGAVAETFSGVYQDVVIKLKGGADRVHFDNDAIISRDLIFRGGGGADSITSEAGAAIGRDLIFLGGAGDSDTALDGITIGRHVKLSGQQDVVLQASNGTQVNGLLSVVAPALAGVTLDNTTLGRLQVAAAEQAGVDLSNILVGGNARIQGGQGFDLIGLSSSNEILGNLVINTQAGNDGVLLNAEVGGNVAVQFGTGANQALITSDLTVYGDLTVTSGGSASDDWNLAGVHVMGRTQLQSGGGDDTVLFNDAEFFGATTFLGGAGADQVQISDGSNVTFNGTTVFDLGDDADTLQLGAGGIGQANFQSLVTLQGGAGADTLLDVNSDFNQLPVIQSF